MKHVWLIISEEKHDLDTFMYMQMKYWLQLILFNSFKKFP